MALERESLSLSLSLYLPLLPCTDLSRRPRLQKLASQAEKMPYEKLSLTSTDILKRKDEVFNVCAPIVTIPKPKAKVDEPKEAPSTKETPEAEMKDAENVPVEGEQAKEGDATMTDLVRPPLLPFLPSTSRCTDAL